MSGEGTGVWPMPPTGEMGEGRGEAGRRETGYYSKSCIANFLVVSMDQEGSLCRGGGSQVRGRDRRCLNLSS